MTQEEINECNRIIAEFDNRDIDWPKYSKAWYDSLKYHTSWDWLMPVVEKIEEDGYVVAICTGSVDISERGEDHSDLDAYVTYDNPKYQAFKADTENKITALFQAILIFIKWHNQIKA